MSIQVLGSKKSCWLNRTQKTARSTFLGVSIVCFIYCYYNLLQTLSRKCFVIEKKINTQSYIKTRCMMFESCLFILHVPQDDLPLCSKNLVAGQTSSRGSLERGECNFSKVLFVSKPEWVSLVQDITENITWTKLILHKLSLLDLYKVSCFNNPLVCAHKLPWIYWPKLHFVHIFNE